MPEPISDVISVNGSGNLQGSGDIAERLISSGLNVNQFRTNDVLRKDEWKRLDESIIEVARARLVGVADLMERGLRFDLTNGLGTTQIEWETVSDMDPAEIDMAGVTEGADDRAVFGLKSLPLPIIHKDFKLNRRHLEASRTRGDSIDTTQARLAARLVAERTETLLFKGSGITVGGSQIYGYTTAPNRNTGSLTGDWSVVGTTGENILSDTLKMIEAAVADNFYGPYVMYVPFDYYNKLLEDFKTNSDKSILTRLLEIPQLEAIKQTKDLVGGATGEVLLIQMTSDVVDEVVGMQPTTLQWEMKGGMQVNFKVMSIMIPRMKSDYSNQSGIAHYSV